MDWDLLLIFLFVIIIVSILGSVANDIAKRVLDYKQAERATGSGHNGTAEVQRLTEKTEMLEDRVRVLERIATDKDSSLAAEIEALRELPDPLLETDREKAAL